MDSKQTFDYNSTSRPQIFLDVQGQDDGYGIKKGKSGGEGTSQYDLVLKNATVNLTWADNTKVLSFVRIQFHRINYQSYDAPTIHLKVTGTDQVVSSCVAPGGRNTVDEDCVEATFTAQQDVRGVTFDVLDQHVYVDLRYIVLGFVDEDVETVAVKYATAFNDAQVCGTTSTSGLDETKWNQQAAAYDALSENVQNYLVDYEGENAEVLEFLERYDRVIYLHGYDYDYMNRNEAVGLTVMIEHAFMNTVNTANAIALAAIAAGIISVAGSIILIAKRKKAK